METYTVKKLRAIAKERGIKRYSSLRKTELIATINAHLADNHNLIDAPVPDISASVLTPTKYVAPPQKEAKTGVLSTIKSFRDWLYVPEQIKKPIKSLPEQIKKPNKSLGALKTKVANNHSLVDAPAPDISGSHLAANNHNLIDAPVPDISAPVLTPTRYFCKKLNSLKHLVRTTVAESHN